MIDDISDNARDFSRSLLELANSVEGNIEKRMMKGVSDLFRRIVQRTPVDTARAKANWQIGFETNDDWEDKTFADPKQGENYSIQKASSFESDWGGFKRSGGEFSFELPDNAIYIFNNVEYIKILEDGSSRQAPNGMVALSLEEMKNYFNGEI